MKLKETQTDKASDNTTHQMAHAPQHSDKRKEEQRPFWRKERAAALIL